MPDSAISILEPVDLRTVWPDETSDFTPWLADPENLTRLGDELGLTLEPRGTEQAVGSFSADILCRRLDGGSDEESWVVIENQYGRTDHDHLGKLLTYTAGLNARTVVWIAEEFRDEHRAALDLLNESTSGEYAYFGVEIELLKIDNSLPAPRFNIVVQPNDWSKTVRSTGPGGELSETKRLQLDFWTDFQRLVESDGTIPVTRPVPTSYVTHRVGASGLRVVSFFSTWNSANQNSSTGEVRVALEFFGRSHRERFDQLAEQADLIRNEAGQPYLWQPWESESILRVMVRRDAEFENRQEWPKYQAWLKTEVELMFRVLVPKAKELAG
ncbi:MAG: DUF4268 domain-containing protein [Chloroflexota bacterium]|nr:DUF4268 domain-containing protein [Chloroflexota bacterium]MDE2920553.1 DUF4268 domain-containing protein [Chloroflexota bacterium]